MQPSSRQPCEDKTLETKGNWATVTILGGSCVDRYHAKLLGVLDKPICQLLPVNHVSELIGRILKKYEVSFPPISSITSERMCWFEVLIIATETEVEARAYKPQDGWLETFFVVFSVFCGRAFLGCRVHLMEPIVS